MYATIAVFFSVIFLSSCGITTQQKSDPTLKTVALHCTVHKPYCGGARPSPDVAAGYYEAMKYEKFKLVKGTEFKEGAETFQEVNLDESGNVTLTLEPGNYMLVRADKFLPLDEFISKNGPFEEENYKLKDNACFLSWKNSVDLNFTVVNDTTIEMRQKAKCWVGTNPCLEYTGPAAP